MSVTLPPGRGSPPPGGLHSGDRSARTKAAGGRPAVGRTAARASPGEVEAGSGRATTFRRLGDPRPAGVRVGSNGLPDALGRTSVETVVEDWVVEDRWWTGRPLRRRYLELVLVDGRNTVVFHDLVGGRWFVQRD